MAEAHHFDIQHYMYLQGANLTCHYIYLYSLSVSHLSKYDRDVIQPSDIPRITCQCLWNNTSLGFLCIPLVVKPITNISIDKL